MASQIDLNNLTSEQWKLVLSQIQVESFKIELFYCAVCNKAKAINDQEEFCNKCESVDCGVAICARCPPDLFSLYMETEEDVTVLCNKCHMKK